MICRYKLASFCKQKRPGLCGSVCLFCRTETCKQKDRVFTFHVKTVVQQSVFSLAKRPGNYCTIIAREDPERKDPVFSRVSVRRKRQTRSFRQLLYNNCRSFCLQAKRQTDPSAPIILPDECKNLFKKRYSLSVSFAERRLASKKTVL